MWHMGVFACVVAYTMGGGCVELRARASSSIVPPRSAAPERLRRHHSLIDSVISLICSVSASFVRIDGLGKQGKWTTGTSCGASGCLALKLFRREVSPLVQLLDGLAAALRRHRSHHPLFQLHTSPLHTHRYTTVVFRAKREKGVVDMFISAC